MDKAEEKNPFLRKILILKSHATSMRQKKFSTFFLVWLKFNKSKITEYISALICIGFPHAICLYVKLVCWIQYLFL